MPAELFEERVVRFERPPHHHTLLRAPNGDYLGVLDGRAATFAFVDDAAIWDRSDGGFTHVATGFELAAEAAGDGCRLRLNGQTLGAEGSASADAAVFRPGHGPAELPSTYLRRFRANGWVCMPAILPPDVVDALERVSCVGAYSDREYDRTKSPLNQDPAVARTAAEPVSLWLTRQYMGTDEIRLAHTPSIRVLERDDGSQDVQGWHSDFPYLWGIGRTVSGDRVPIHTTDRLVLGVQRNICISEFTKVGGATAFKLGSHERQQGPPEDWGTGNDYRHRGYRAEHGLPYSGPDADIVEAPAGSIILYDARTWHRSGINRTDNRRAAMLQAVVPMFVTPFSDTSGDIKAFLSGPLAEKVTERERREVAAILVNEIVGPGGRWAITVDPELTRMARPDGAPGAY